MYCDYLFCLGSWLRCGVVVIVSLVLLVGCGGWVYLVLFCGWCVTWCLRGFGYLVWAVGRLLGSILIVGLVYECLLLVVIECCSCYVSWIGACLVAVAWLLCCCFVFRFLSRLYVLLVLCLCVVSVAGLFGV